jgi:hypothetical protein
MKKLFFNCFILLLAVNLIVFTIDCQGQTQSRSATLSTAGGTTESTNFKMISLVGQTVQAGSANSTNFYLYGSLLAVTRDLEMPDITPLSPITTPQNAGQDISIETTITDNVNVAEATLHYREGGSTLYSTLTMTQAGDVFSENIPGSVVGSKGVDYYISASDVNNNVSQTDIFSVYVALTDSGIVKGAAQDAGSAQTAYRLISIPLDATDKTPAAVVEDDLGAYDNTKWRFYELQTDQQYVEYPNTANMNPGKAFWLIVKDANKVIDTGPGNTNLIDETFTVPLAAGWTLIGNPFNYNIPYANIAMENDSALDIRSYNGSWNVYISALSPFEGYAVYSEMATNLIIDPYISPNPTQLPKPLASGLKENWAINIEAVCQDARDTDNKAKTGLSTSVDFDRFDRPEPPVIGEYVSVYFPHPEWNKVSKNYCIDARPVLNEGEIWQFEVKTNINDKVNLSFKNIDSVPNEYEVWLVDEQLKVSHNLRETNSYEIGASQNYTNKLILAVGNSAFINEKFNEYNLIPSTYELFQNFPNPFNPVTTIRYGLPKDTKVSLKVFNLLGQEVASLMNNVEKNAGYHTIIWDGRNLQGKTVASGMYIYTLKSNKFSDVKKMIFVK